MHTQSFFFSSNPESGAQNVTADGSTFNVEFSTPLSIPPEAQFAELGLASANIWNTSPNISPVFNNNVLVYAHSGATTNIVFPEGLYSLDEVNAEIARQVPVAVSFKPIQAQQKTELELGSGAAIDFATSTLGTLLGFPPSAGTVSTNGTISPAAAKLNRNNTLLIRTDMITAGLPVNSLARGIIGQVPLAGTAPGSLVNYQPNNILWVDASELIGNSRQNVRFELVNEAEQRVPTSGDTYQFVLQLRWG